jgi:hypothetical protein
LFEEIFCSVVVTKITAPAAGAAAPSASSSATPKVVRTFGIGASIRSAGPRVVPEGEDRKL